MTDGVIGVGLAPDEERRAIDDEIASANQAEMEGL
jgi:hypothetical protein